MDLEALFSLLWDWVSQFYSWVISVLNYIWQALWTALNYVWSGVVSLARGIWRQLSAVIHMKWGDIWRWLHKQWARLKRYLQWWQDHVQAPLDRMRRSVWALYDQFFKPILRVLDSFRVFTRAIAIFNRRLAAKIDGALFGLEAKLMYPITAMLKRLNEISSWQRAVFTRLGLLDRVLLIESLRRDAGIVWEVLTNPRARIYGPISHPPARGVHDMVQDAKDFYRDGTGAYAQDVMDLQETFRNAVREIE
jgi:hypothetical protein